MNTIHNLPQFQSRWQWQNPLPQGYVLNDVYFIDNQNGWAVGYNGTILYTTDGGQSWLSQTSGTTNHLKRIQFVDSQDGWAVGDNGTILQTSNGGITWLAESYETTRSFFSWVEKRKEITENLNSVHFIDSQNGWVVGINGTILRTRNSGRKWSRQNSKTNYKLNDVYFFNEHIGWVVGENTFLCTRNGGRCWNTIDYVGGRSFQANPYGTNPNSYSLDFIHFSDRQNGWAVGSWQSLNDPMERQYMISVPVKLSTCNGGRSWEEQNA
jgi:photosystem II stability/assembly factor-like uncharacterized protein